MKAIFLVSLLIFTSCTAEYRLVPEPILVEKTVLVPAPILDMDKLAWPIDDPKITSPFGKRSDLRKTRTGGGDSLHEGLDIISKDGTKIHAMIHTIQDGTVVAVFGPRHQHKTFGICLLIRHEAPMKWKDGTPFVYYSLYAHLSEPWVSTGDTVKQGDPIGRMGKTGDAEGYHLHFEILFDPADFLAPLN